MIETRLQKIYTYTFIVLAAAAICFPVIFSVLLSFSSNVDITNSIYIPSELHFENYLRAFQVQPLVKYLINSLIVSVSSTLLQIVLALLSSYAIVFLSFKPANKKSRLN